MGSTSGGEAIQRCLYLFQRLEEAEKLVDVQEPIPEEDLHDEEPEEVEEVEEYEGDEEEEEDIDY